MSEPFENPDPARLFRLTAEKCNETLDPAGRAELEELLLNSPEACEQYWEQMSLHAQLEWELSGGGRTPKEIVGLSAAKRGAPWKAVLSLALASCALGVAVLGYQGWLAGGGAALVAEQAERREGSDRLAPIVGRIQEIEQGSHWSFGRKGDRNPQAFRQGDTLWLDRGVISLTLTSNTTAELEAPVILQVLSVDRVRVLDGRIHVDVPEGAEGFAVETAAAEVVDLGTNFSVDVTEKNTDVIVFEGEIDLKVAESSDHSNADAASVFKRFRGGEAVRVNKDGTLSRIVTVQQSTRAGRATARPQTIQSVRDNIQRDGVFSFYEIVPGGMKEDAKTHVDRTHEWNGATASGLPSYLLGADYVKTFCDDKVTLDLEIELELREPAAVYIILDDRLTPPEWLAERFEDTGDDVGIDESFYDEGRLPAIGPGKSIERTFSVWKHVAEQGGVVYLGPNGDTSPEERARGIRARSAMYGIAAVPLDEGN